MARRIRVTLCRSVINRPETQKRTVRGLGLRKVGQTVEVPDSASVRGMVREIGHLVRVSAAG